MQELCLFREMILVLRVHSFAYQSFQPCHMVFFSELTLCFDVVDNRKFLSSNCVTSATRCGCRWWGGPTQYPGLQLAVAVGS